MFGNKGIVFGCFNVCDCLVPFPPIGRVMWTVEGAGKQSNLVERGGVRYGGDGLMEMRFRNGHRAASMPIVMASRDWLDDVTATPADVFRHHVT